MSLRATRTALRAAIAAHEKAADGDSNDAEHEAAIDLREAAAELLSESLRHLNPSELLSNLRTAADDMLLADHHWSRKAAEELREAFLDLDDLLSEGGPLPSDWRQATLGSEG